MTAPTPLTDEHIRHFSYLQQQINIMAWLHAELVYQLQTLLANQQALVNRAKAVRLVQQNRNRTKGQTGGGILRPQ